jgi:hypothetical protein
MTRPIIQARQFAEDIRSGMSDFELMEKYRLSAKGIQSAFSKLLDNGIVTVEELYGGRARSGADTVIIDDPRRIPRHYLSVSVSIYDPNLPTQKGKLHDITERGIGVRGLEVRIGETKAFVIPCRDFLGVDNLWFEAKCLWVRPAAKPSDWRAGFQITKITPEYLTHLRELIHLLTLG